MLFANALWAQVPRTVYSVDMENKIFEQSISKNTIPYKYQNPVEKPLNVYKNYNKNGFLQATAGVAYTSGRKSVTMGDYFDLQYRQGYGAKLSGGMYINPYIALGADMGLVQTTNALLQNGAKVGRRESTHIQMIPTITINPLPRSAIQPYFRFGAGVESVKTQYKYNKASTLQTNFSCTSAQTFEFPTDDVPVVDNPVPAGITATVNGDIITLRSLDRTLLATPNGNGALCNPQLDENQAPITDDNGNTTPDILSLTTGQPASSPSIAKGNYNIATKIEIGADVQYNNWGINLRMERVWHDILEDKEYYSTLFSLGGKLNF